MPMLDITNVRKRDRPDSTSVENPVFKQARLAYDVSQEARHRTGYACSSLSQLLLLSLPQLHVSLPLLPMLSCIAPSLPLGWHVGSTAQVRAC